MVITPAATQVRPIHVLVGMIPRPLHLLLIGDLLRCQLLPVGSFLGLPRCLHPTSPLRGHLVQHRAEGIEGRRILLGLFLFVLDESHEFRRWNLGDPIRPVRIAEPLGDRRWPILRERSSCAEEYRQHGGNQNLHETELSVLEDV
jgi:hypothetical protein